MTQYLLSVHVGDEVYSAEPSKDTERMYAQVDAFNVELFRSGAFIFADGLEPSSTATVVKFENGKTATTDGPYMETKEHIGGFWIIRVNDMDAALAWAAKASAACEGPVEVRPFQQRPNEI